MKLLLLNIILFFGMVSEGVTQNWIPVEHSESGLSVKMPNVPKYTPEDVYTLNGITKKITYSTQYDDIDIEFEIQKMFGSGKKAEKTAIKQLIKNTTVENHGNSPKIVKQKKGDISYTYVETPLITGEMIRSSVLVHNGYIFQIYVKGIIVNVFNESANKFLDSWSIASVDQLSEEIDIIEDEVENQVIEDTKKTWVSLNIEPALEIQFPEQPFMKSTVIENGLNDIEITSYAYTDRENGKTYIVSVRPYTRDQGQLTNASIYYYYLDRIKTNKNLKLTSEELIDRPNEGIEYVFSSGIRFYRLKLIRVNNVMYQFLIKGKRKNIYNEDSEYFFNSFNISN